MKKNNKICYDSEKSVLLRRITENVIHEINNQVCVLDSNSDALKEYSSFLLKEAIKNNVNQKTKEIKEDLPSLLEDNQQAISKNNKNNNKS